MQTKDQNKFYMLLFFAMIGWGASWVSVKILGRYIDEYEMILFRFGITGLSMIPIIVYMRKSFYIDPKSLGIVIAASIVFIAYMKYFFLGTKLGTASLGGAFVTTLAPIITFLLLALMGEKRITAKESFALVLGAVGVLTMLGVWNRHLNEVLVIHNLYFVLAATLWPILTIISARSTKISPLVFTFYMYLVTVMLDLIFFVDISDIDVASFDSVFWINLFIISIISTTFANTIYFIGIERLGTGEVSSFIFLVPFSAIGLSALFLGEEIGIAMIAGTAMTLYAVKILNGIKFGRKNR